jgi:hypothetical protein
MKREQYANQQNHSSFQPQLATQQSSLEHNQLNQPTQHSSAIADQNNSNWFNKANQWMTDKVQAAQTFVNGTGAIATDDILPALQANKHANLAQSGQPLVGIIDSGFGANEHGTQMLNTIREVNPEASVVLKDGVSKGGWAESLTEFVDTAKASGQTGAVANLSFDLTEVHPDGTVTTRSQLTAEEQTALAYARDNNVLVVASAGNEGGAMSALGQASQQFENVIAVGAAEGNHRAEYSSFGSGLDLVANGSKNGQEGTSFAAAEVTGAISEIWEANSQLSARQVNQTLQATATDLHTSGWDAETGFGQLNVDLARSVAQQITPDTQSFSGADLLYQAQGSFDGATWQSKDGSVASERSNFRLRMPNLPSPSDAVNAVRREAREAGSAVRRTTRDVANTVRREAREAGSAVRRTTRDAANTVRREAREAGSAVRRTTRDAANTVRREAREAGSAVRRTTRDAANTVRREAREAGSAVRRTTRDAASTVRREAREASSAVRRTTRDAANTVRREAREASSAVRRTTRDAASTVRREAREAGSAVAQTSREVGRETQEAWRDTSDWTRRNYGTISEVGHTALDVAGMIPVVGAVADGVNAAWYLAEGDYANAALSGVGMIPGLGDAATATRLGMRGARLIRNGDRVVDMGRQVDNVLSRSGRVMEVAALPAEIAGTVQGSGEAYNQFSQGNYLQGGLALTQAGMSAAGVGSGLRSSGSRGGGSRNGGGDRVSAISQQPTSGDRISTAGTPQRPGSIGGDRIAATGTPQRPTSAGGDRGLTPALQRSGSSGSDRSLTTQPPSSSAITGRQVPERGTSTSARSHLSSGQSSSSRNSGDDKPLGARGGSLPLREPNEWGTHRGAASRRPFSPDQAGGTIQNLSTDRLKIQENGINRVEQHLSRFGDDAQNQAQIQRLREIAAGNIEPTEADLNFYAHELRESVRYRKLGYEDRGTGDVWQPSDSDQARQVWNDAHTATLEDYGIKEGTGVLYHPSVEGGGDVSKPLGGRGPREFQVNTRGTVTPVPQVGESIPELDNTKYAERGSGGPSHRAAYDAGREYERQATNSDLSVHVYRTSEQIQRRSGREYVEFDGVTTGGKGSRPVLLDAKHVGENGNSVYDIRRTDRFMEGVLLPELDAQVARQREAIAASGADGVEWRTNNEDIAAAFQERYDPDGTGDFTAVAGPYSLEELESMPFVSRRSES